MNHNQLLECKQFYMQHLLNSKHGIDESCTISCIALDTLKATINRSCIPRIIHHQVKQISSSKYREVASKHTEKWDHLQSPLFLSTLESQWCL